MTVSPDGSLCASGGKVMRSLFPVMTTEVNKLDMTRFSVKEMMKPKLNAVCIPYDDTEAVSEL